MDSQHGVDSSRDDRSAVSRGCLPLAHHIVYLTGSNRRALVSDLAGVLRPGKHSHLNSARNLHQSARQMMRYGNLKRFSHLNLLFTDALCDTSGSAAHSTRLTGKTGRAACNSSPLFSHHMYDSELSRRIIRAFHFLPVDTILPVACPLLIIVL
jgi:hypothetical protein